MTYTLITSTEQLESACHQLSQHQVIAVDTEFKRETTYFPIPCLFQLASTESTICIDPFQIDNLAPLGDLLSNKSIIKIFHAGRQDLEIFYYLFKQLPAPIFDTQIAAAILGFPSQVGYAKLVSDYMGIELDKSLTRADWEKRPLPEKQLEYAANDVIYLLQVYDKQIEALKDTGRLDWPDADCEALLDESLYRPDPLSAWTKMRNYNYFTSQERAVASAICQWREELAIERNRPRKFIFDNPVISELSTHQPVTLG
ncbi:MAG: HRDC domain-containing protein, partial [Gammaproteobacteria bacterium]|nr:HRDC domain-containing protein [Gammaproteobacteria bacterium]